MLDFSEYVRIIEESLESLLEVRDCPQMTIYEAMKYSVDAGGKRLRPALCLAACDLVGGNISDAIPFACAIEMIHTFSLIHDDLPCMDNDDYRRGKLTSHKVFGEGMAVLAGDALTLFAFETAAKSTAPADRVVRAISYMASFSGRDGMIGGQVVDIESENKVISADILRFLHENKTSALLCESLVCGAIIGGADEKIIDALKTYGLYLGLAFQVQDDILDVVGESAVLGKNAGSDAENGKNTYVSMFGLEKAREFSMEYTKKAISAFKDIDNSEFFIDFANALMQRKK